MSYKCELLFSSPSQFQTFNNICEGNIMNKKSPSIDNNNNDSRFLIHKYFLQINDKCKISYDLILLLKYLDMLRRPIYLSLLLNFLFSCIVHWIVKLCFCIYSIKMFSSLFNLVLLLQISIRVTASNLLFCFPICNLIYFVE